MNNNYSLLFKKYLLRKLFLISIFFSLFSQVLIAKVVSNQGLSLKADLNSVSVSANGTHLATKYDLFGAFQSNYESRNIFIDKNLSITDFLHSNFSTYQLYSHGRPGELFIDGHWKNAKEIVDFLQSKFSNQNISQLNIYGCEFAKGEKGLAAVHYLETQLGVSVSASTNITGKDGDWILEVGNSNDVVSLPNYNGSLQTVGGTLPADDFDGDGIINQLDIDDDNDGVLDWVESPGCFITTLNSNLVYTQFGPVTATSSIPAANDGGFTNITNIVDNNATTSGNLTNYNWGGSTSAPNNTVFFTFQFANAVALSNINFNEAIIWLGSDVFLVEAANAAGGPWTTVTTANTSIGTGQNFNFSLTNSTAYTYYRIKKVSGTAGFNANAVTGVEFVPSTTTYNSSYFLSGTCTATTENYMNLDSDGDGCSDAYESGVPGATASTTTVATSANVGTNGYANSLETAVDNGIPSFVNTYFKANSASITACGVEACGDHIDNNGNGLIDEQDPTGPCFVTATGTGCPAPALTAGIRVAWSYTTDNATQHIVSGKFDGTNTVYLWDGSKVYNGTTHNFVKRIPTATPGALIPMPIGALDVDGDGVWEFFKHLESTTNKIECYNWDGTLKYTATLPATNLVSSSTGISFADFNHDGIPEFYIGNTIFNAQTGVLLLDGGAANQNGDPTVGSVSTTGIGTISLDHPVSTAADVKPGGNLELVAGTTIYDINITSTTGTTGNTITANLIPGIYSLDAYAYVADMNKDGFLDVITIDPSGTQTAAPYKMEIRIWDPRSKTLLSTYTQNNGSGINSGVSGNTYAAIGDIDGDGYPEIVIGKKSLTVGGNSYFCAAYDYDGNATLTQKWVNTSSTDSSTEYMYPVLFDFNGDGKLEVVFRGDHGSDGMQIIDGTTGTTKMSALGNSITNFENTIIADIDNDGEAEIIGNNSSSTMTIFKSTSNSGGQPWADATTNWNQLNFRPTTLLENGTANQYESQNTVANNTENGKFSIMDANGNPIANFCPLCAAGSTAPVITPTTATNTCPTTTVDLSTLANTGTVPSGAALKWSTSASPTSTNILTSTVVSTSGTYYAYYYDATNNCFSPGDSVVVTISTCCDAGSTAPVITPTTATNTCPTTTVDLSTLANTGTVPSGAALKWSTSATPTSSSDVLTSSVVSTSGTYYAYYYDATNNCFSPGDSVVVTISTCCAAVSTAPVITPTTATNTCPTTTVDLSTLANTGTVPTDTSLVWSTSATPTSTNILPSTVVSTSGTYYAYYYDATNNCFSPGDSVVVTISTCCAAVSTAPVITPTTATNTCPTTTVDLSTLANTGTVPTDTSLVWSTSATPTSTNILPSTVVSTSGTYYAYYYDATNNCFSPGDSVVVTISTCCAAGSTAPVITPTTATNTCPTTTVDLSTLANTGTVPSGAALKWSTSATPTSSSDVLPSTVVSTSGTYYAYYYDATNNCFSPGDSVVVTISTCSSTFEAVDDDFTGTPVTNGDSTPSVVDNNDLLDGVTPVIGTNPGEVTLTGLSVPTELTLNSDGTITVEPNTPSGTYTVVYEICENEATPANCDTATVTILVENVIDVVDDDFTGTPVTNGDSTPSVVDNNDLLDGVTPVIGTNPGEVTLTGLSVPTELTLNSDGTITVEPNTPSGTYTVVYEICENEATPANCDTATVTILVENVIDVVDDDFTGTPVTNGDSTPSVVDNNDLLDGVTPVIGTNPGEVTLTGLSVPTELTLNSDGTITVEPNTPSGTYTVVYEICENEATPANCDTATVTILVENVIDVVDDDFTGTPVTNGDSTPSVVDNNDLLDGVTPVIGTNPGEVTLTGLSVPTELTLNSDGTITVEPNTPSGTYTVVYEICENEATPANCDTATVTILVENVIDVVDDDFTGTPVTNGDSTPSVVDNNDLLDGVTPVIGTNPGEVTLTGLSVPTELTLNSDGTITVEPNTPSGTYTVVYEICENEATPANCDTATVTILVENVIDVVDDDFTGTPVTNGDSTPSVVDNNDLLDGVTPVIGTNPGEVTLTGLSVPTELTLNSDGTITVEPNTPSGTYTVVYEICENEATPANCDTATVTILVENVIDVVDDDFTGTPVTNGDSTPSVVDNNDLLDGVTPVIGTNPGEVTLTGLSVPTELTLNADGTITVEPNTPSGTYTVVYEICENEATPANCDTATVTILVENVIDVVDDDFTGTPVTNGDSTPSVVDNNDLLDGVTPVIGTNPGEVTLTGLSVPTELTLNSDGTITVEPNTPSGTYTVVYEICENEATPANCDTATVTILVENVIDVVDDDFTGTPVTNGDSTPSVVDNNDLLDGVTPVIGTNPGEVTLTGLSVPTELTLNSDGTITVEPNTPSGTYTVVYEICENEATPANCDTATVTILVENVIDAVEDDFTGTPVTNGDSTPSVVDNNDLLDGVTPVIGTNPGEVTLTGLSVPTELTLNSDGTITVEPNTPSGTYTVVYEICENEANPTNCDTATVTILVENVIDAVEDDFTGTPVTNGDSTPSVVDNNDLLDGVTPVIGTNPGEVTLTGLSVPTELTLNADGTITVEPNTPSGTYTVVYEICENEATPANCDTATVTILVENVIDAVDDDFTGTPVTNGDSTPSVVDNNDLLDGVTPVIGTNPGEVTLTGLSVPTELTLNADGTITVEPNTPSGTYTVVYEICENEANPTNCDTATVTILVENVIDAVEDDFTGTPVTNGDSTPSVVLNDTLDNEPVVIGTNPGEVTLTGTTVPAELTLNPDGTITVEPNTPSGTYTVVYEICENEANPTNCDTATVTILVENVIDAVEDDFTGTPVTNGDSTPSVVLNDTLDNAPVVIGTNPGEVTLTGLSVPAELTLNPDGTITVEPNTPSGTYTVVYEICENGANPTNCDTATVTILVENVIDAVEDDFTGTPVTNGDSTPSVVDNNDLLDGVTPVIGTNPGEVTLTGLSVPTELTLNADGTITVEPNTPSGTYTVVYEICENGATPMNCDTATVTILVENVIDAVDDDFTGTPVTNGDSTPSVVDNNDLLDGVTPVIGTNPGEVTLTGLSVPTELTLNADGTITVEPNTPSGTYTVVYEICENGASPMNCDTATVTILVENVIDAVEDDFTGTPVTNGDSTPSVVDNNDLLDGVTPVIGTNPGEVTLTGLSVPTELTLNADGTITVEPNTPSGTYTVVYEICENGASPMNCDTATVTILVENVIDAVDDDFTGTPVTNGDSTPSVVDNNDLLDGVTPVIGTNPGEVTLTGLSVPTELTLNADGTITVEPNTPSGTYTVVYEICENGASPMNCDTATVTILVENVIDAVEDDFTGTPVTNGDSTPSVVDNNDLLDGVTPVIGTNPGEVTLTGLSVPTELTLNADGTITVEPNTPSGTYTVVYEICENGASPMNCDTATVTILVENVIDAVEDDFTGTPVTNGDSTPSVVDNNDLLDGVTPVIGTNPGEVTLTGLSVPTELTLNADGTITVNPNTPSGTYTVVYEICENGATPMNCDTATVTILVENVIDAVEDDFTGTPVTNGDSTPSVVDNNDLLDGVTPVIGTNPGEVTLTGLIVPTELTLNADGTITVEPNTPSGTYTVVYEICENGANPTNCDTATVTILVENVIDAVEDDLTSTPINGYTGGVTLNVVENNDTLDGAQAQIGTNPGQVTLTLITPATAVTPGANVPVLDVVTGIVIVPDHTPAGTYTIVYEICEVGATPNPPGNCDQATITIVVTAAPLIAEDDDFTSNPVNGYDGETYLGNVLYENNTSLNDTLNNLPVLTEEVDITIITPATSLYTGANVPSIDINTGDVTVPAQTPAGTYTIGYQICEVLNPNNCDQATVTIVVLAPPIDAVDDNYSQVPINGGIQNTLTIFLNDTLNDNPLVAAEVLVSIVDEGGIAGVQISQEGVVTIPANTPAGTYILTYQICQLLNPGVCDTALMTIVVKEPCEFDDSPVACDLIVFNALTIGNDGINEAFVIEGIENYPNNTVEIYNRWGVLVYDADGYDNNTKVFRGISEGRVTIKRDSELPEGTYFYVLKYTKNNGQVKEKAGYLYINRQ